MDKQLAMNLIAEQLSPEELLRQTLESGEGILADTGALCIRTGKFTGRSPDDKYIVKDTITGNQVDWNPFNNPIEDTAFVRLRDAMFAWLGSAGKVWAQNVFAGADDRYRLRLRVITTTPWSSLFAANMFIRPTEDELEQFDSDWTIIHAPSFEAEPMIHGTRNKNFTVMSFQRQMILIGGTGYTGEIKKAVFTALNFVLPLSHQVLSMHCSANEGDAGDVALFFGLSGTGKTTLSADASRKLIGDDEHGWSDGGIFNIEGGCYAKIINLSAAEEPEIFGAIRTGALVENAILDADSRIDFANRSITENTRASYPLSYIPGAKHPSTGSHPRNIFFLACDACGALPPISRLDEEQAYFYFMNGYTAKVAGTEMGALEPKVTFSACFGAPFLPLHPRVYAGMLIRNIRQHRSRVWLVNTGWIGGPCGKGKRISLACTRAMVNAALNGKLDHVEYQEHNIFQLAMPVTCPGVPEELLNPELAWPDSGEYELAARRLNTQFQENFSRISIG